MKRKKKSEAEPVADRSEDLQRKVFEEKLKELHGELVKLQQWVVHKGLKVCIVFEGRDGAGKGGTIKAMTERVSPRIFRVVALPAPRPIAETVGPFFPSLRYFILAERTLVGLYSRRLDDGRPADELGLDPFAELLGGSGRSGDALLEEGLLRRWVA